MDRIDLPLQISIEHAEFLQSTAEKWHCTLTDLVEVAIEPFIERMAEKHDD